MALIERSDVADVTVTVRHRCPSFVFGSALGPYEAVTFWWRIDGGEPAVATTAEAHSRPAVVAAIRAYLAGATDLRRHLDELAELPDVPG